MILLTCDGLQTATNINQIWCNFSGFIILNEKTFDFSHHQGYVGLQISHHACLQ
jgi:hypothetical protein